MICPNCNFENPEQFKFCGECGTRIVDIVPEPSSELNIQEKSINLHPEFHYVDAERRHITVMFCDMVGSTQLSEQLDPEDFRQILHVYQDTCVYVVNQFEGHLAQYLGDGVLIYFGYPEAHADDSQRAIRCGLEILDELGRINELQTQFKGIKLSIRIGIHTGLVVVGEMERGRRSSRLALGNTPNIAARLQALADPDTIVISEETYRLVSKFFTCQSLGAYNLKGVSHEKAIYRVLNEMETVYSFKTVSNTGTTPFVGRENEILELLDTWENVKRKHDEVAYIIGEPGMGKTRLLRGFEERIKDEPHTWLVCRCIAYYKNSAFYPIINLINAQLKLGKHDPPEEKLQKLESTLSHFDFNLDETIPILASLLSIPISKPYQAVSLTPEKQKEKTIQILLDWLIQSARQNPLLFVIEDVHWADSSTLEHLSLLMEKIDQAQILIILTFHPRFQPPVNEKSHLTEIILNRLTHTQIENMVKEVTGDRSLPTKVIDLLLTKTDGVPLFVEELTKMLLESKYLIEEDGQYKLKGYLPKTEIPETLQDTLMARLDRLGAVKEVVQLAAIIGREFSFDLINAASSLDEETLKNELKNLVEADILDEPDDPQHIGFTFNQVLIQDAAYNSVLKSTRRDLHKKIARIIEAQFTEIVKTHPQIVAHHYEEAREIEKAIEYYLISGTQLTQQSAHREAIGQLRSGLRLLNQIVDRKLRDQLELDLLIALGIPLLATMGYGNKEVGIVYEKARELSQKIGNIPKIFPALVGQYRFYLLRGDLIKAFDISELLLGWALTSRDSHLILEANRSIGVTLFHMGEIVTAVEHLEEAIKQYNPEEHKAHIHIYSSDPLITCLSYGALSHCLLGYPDKAFTYGDKAVAQARKIKHPFSLVFALNHHAWLNQFYKKTDLVDKFASELVEVSGQYGFPFWQITGLFFKGWVASHNNQVDIGINQMESSIKAFQSTGAGSVLPYFKTAVAEVYLENANPTKALKWLEQAENRAQKNREHFFDAEIYRVKGEATAALGKNNKKEAESLLWRAIETARRQKLKALELRAIMSLVRISKANKDMLKLLKDLSSWFQEGLESHDLKAAGELLQQRNL
jgi:class 3 adenylate cyclase/predicted ATPase